MLHIITGAMKAGKSKTLIDCTEMFKDNKNYKIFYPSCCNKKDGYIYTRYQDKKIKAIKIYEVNDLYQHLTNDIDCIFIDEFTFLCSENEIDSFMNILEYCDTKGIDVYLFGLTLDYLSRSFQTAQRVLPYCDTLTHLTATCEVCGSEHGTRCVRFVNGIIDSSVDSDLVQLESDNVEYKTVCRKCYRELTGLNAIK